MKWMPEDEKMLLGIWIQNYIPVGSGGFWDRPKAEAYYCAECKILIHHVKEKFICKTKKIVFFYIFLCVFLRVFAGLFWIITVLLS